MAIYTLRTLLAVDSHLEWFKKPGIRRRDKWNIFVLPLHRIFCIDKVDLFSALWDLNAETEVKSRTQGSRSRPRIQKNPRPRHTFQGQTLLRPRTGMLDAKAKDTARKCSPPKKSLLQDETTLLMTLAYFHQVKK